MPSETAKNLVSIASALIRMEEGMGKKKAESTRQKNVSKRCPAPASAAPKRHLVSLNIYLTLLLQVFSVPL